VDTIDMVGITASVISVIYTGFGMPVQIYKNYTVKSTAGLSLSMMVLLFLTLISWVVYGFLKTDWYIILPNFIGSISVTVIFIQFWLYRKTGKIILKNR